MVKYDQKQREKRKINTSLWENGSVGVLGIKEHSRPQTAALYGCNQEEEFSLCLRAAEAPQSSAIGILRGTACAPQSNIKKPPRALLKRQICVASSHPTFYFVMCERA